MSEDYMSAKKLGEKSYREEIISGSYPYLPALSEIVRNFNMLKEEKLGLFEIPINLISGTINKGRQEAFAKNYMPLLAEESEFASKWLNVLQHQLNEGIRDPVIAYEFMGRFYISEGNKRVSVLKYLGQPDILADVTRILPPDTSTSKEVKIYSEFLEFFKHTKIYGIYFSNEGSYNKLAEIYGMQHNRMWPENVIMDLKSEFYNFSRLFSEHMRKNTSMTFGDAFVIYLNMYSPESLLSDPDETVSKNLNHLFPKYNSILTGLLERLKLL